MIDSGFRILEIPLTSPDAYASIRLLRAALDGSVVVGAGTVLSRAEVRRVVDAGGQICVSPHCDVDIIQASLEFGVVPIPGVATATEAIRAVQAGARLLKLFPASVLGTETLKAILTVLPPGAGILAVGGIDSENLGEFLAAGAVGVGTGTNLYENGSGRSADEVGRRGRALLAALKAKPTVSAVQNTGTVGGGNCRRIAATETMVGESPHVDSSTGDIQWVDFATSMLYRCAATGGTAAGIKLDTTLSAIMESPDGSTVGICADGVVKVDRTTGRTAIIATVEHPFPDCRLNDGAIDGLGRVWCGSMSYPLRSGQGSLYVIDQHEVHRVADGFGVCNGMGWSPGYGTLYMVDTLLRTLLTFDCDMETGQLTSPESLPISWASRANPTASPWVRTAAFGSPCGAGAGWCAWRETAASHPRSCCPHPR